MDTVEKIHFAYNCYDFDSVGSLNYDEMTILIRSVVKGLGKIAPSSPVFTSPMATDIEQYAILIFEHAGASRTGGGRVSTESFRQYSTSHPVLSSWLKAVASFPSPETSSPEVRDKLVPLRNSFPQLAAKRARRPMETAAHASAADFAPRPTVVLNEAGEEELVYPEAAVKAEHPAPVWAAKAGLLRPEEELAAVRTDPPEDVFEPLWVAGINTSKDQQVGVAPVPMHRCARYSPGGGGATILFAAANQLVSMVKGDEEESGWVQKTFAEHSRAVSCLDVNAHRGIVVTADDASAAAGCPSKIVVWDAAREFAVLGTVSAPLGVKLLDLSHNGALLLVVSADAVATATVYNIRDCGGVFTVFATQLLAAAAATSSILDARFIGTAAIFAVADTHGLRYFSDEGSGAVCTDGPTAMRSYEERTGLYQAAGKAARGVAVTVLSSFEQPDELVAGTEKGQIMLWRGRACSQLVEAHKAAVSSLDFNAAIGTLVSAAVDGTVCVFKIAVSGLSGGLAKKGPKAAVVRELQLDASFDILGHNLFSYAIRSASQSADSSRALIATAGNELVEVALRCAPPSEEELAAAAEEAGEEGGIPASGGKLGDDVNGGAVVAGHFPCLTSSSTIEAVVTALCRLPGESGFASCGSDQTVRLWASSAPEGSPAAAYRVSRSTRMDCACNGLDASATMLGVSLSGGANYSRTGSVHLFSLPDLVFAAELTEHCKTQAAVVDLKFSPDGGALSVASSDGSIYVYVSNEGAWTLKGSIPSGLAATEVPRKIDYSADGQYIRTVYQPSQEFRVWDVSTAAEGTTFGSDLTDIAPPPEPTYDEDGELIPVPAAPGIEVLRSLAWASHSCPHNWDTEGALSLNMAAEELAVAAFDRSNHLLVGAASNGAVLVDRVPSLKVTTASGGVTAADAVQFFAHIGPVSSLCFIEEGARLVTCGAVDGAVRVWRVLYDLDEPEPDALPTEGDEEEDSAAEAAAEEEDDGTPKLEALYDSGEEEDLADGLLPLKAHLSERTHADEPASAVTPWAAMLGLDADSAAKESMIALAAAPSLVPNDELTLDWVYGCSTRGTRGAVRYAPDGRIVYPAGAMGVVYDKLSHSQTHAMAHCDEITCMDVHAASGLAVSAHKGRGNIYAVLWSTADGSVRRTLDCGVVGGVSAVCFSNDGKYVLAACQDSDHTNLFFSASDGRLVARCKGGQRKTLNLTFSLASGDAAASCRILQGGVTHFKFLTFVPSQGTLSSKTGAYGEGLKKSNVLCAAALPLQTLAAEGGEPPSDGNEFALGMADGTVGIIARGESKVSAFTPVHSGSVTAICVVRLTEGSAEEPPTYKIVTAGTGGALKVLDQECAPLLELNLYLKDYGLHGLGRVRGFKSLCADKLSRKLLYATAAGEIGEIEVETGADVNAGPLVSAHFRDQLHAMCTHPLRQECVTAGEDQTLRVWNLDTRAMATKIDLPDIARCVTYAPNGHIVAVGLGGLAKGEGRTQPRALNGRVLVVSYLQGVLRIVHTAHNASDVVTSVLFSPDGSKLFAASADGSIYVYDALDNFSLVQTLAAHSEGVAHIDISEDGARLVSMGAASELVVWDLEAGAPLSTEADRFEALATLSTNYWVRQGTFGLNSVGVFPPNSHAAEVLSLAQSKDAKLLATGDCFGGLKLFRNPACEYFAPHKEYAGHSAGGVSKVAFSVDDEYLVSAGRCDRTLLQWRVVKGTDLPDPRPHVAGAAGDGDDAAMVEEDFNSSFTVRGVDFSKAGTTPPNSSELQPYLKAVAGVGSHHLPAKGEQKSSELSAPSSAPLPKALFCGQGEILTAYGRCLTLLQSDSTAQSPLPIHRPLLVSSFGAADHNQQVSSYAVSQCGRMVAVGHSADSRGSRLELVRVPSGQLACVLSENIVGGVVAVDFSPDGHTVACVAGDAQHSLYLFTSFSGAWDDATLLFVGQVSAATVNLVTFLAPAPASPIGERPFDLVTAGEGHIKFWRISGRNVTSTCGDYGDGLAKPVITAVTSCRGAAQAAGQLITGDAAGNVHLWQGEKRDRLLFSHAESAVTALRSYHSEASGRSGFVSASNDRVVIWSASSADAELEAHSEVAVTSILSSVGWTADIYLGGSRATTNFVTCISADPACSRLLLSFSSGVVATLATDSHAVQKVSEGHGGRVLQVLARPTDVHTVVTLCEDNVVRVWDLSRATVLGSASLNTSSGTSQLAGFVALSHTVCSAAFINPSVLLVGVTGGDNDGTSGSVVAIDLSVIKANVDGHKFELVLSNKIHNVGTGPVRQIRVSPNNKQVLACSSDGCGYLYDIPPYITGAPAATRDDEEGAPDPRLFQGVGFLLAHPGGAPVVGADFSADNRYIRTFGRNFAHVNGKVEVSYFDLEAASTAPTAMERGAGNSVRKHAAAKVQDASALTEIVSSDVQWASVSSPAAPEVRGVSYDSATCDLLVVESLSVSQNNHLVCAGYSDGTAQVFRHPVCSPATHTDSRLRAPLAVHSGGAVLAAFTGSPAMGTQQLVTVGESDGALFVWNIHA